MKKETEERIELYCEIYNKLYEKVSKANAEHGVEISLAIFGEVAKDLRTELIAQRKSVAKDEGDMESVEDLATTRQREALHKFGIKTIPESLSVSEASEILDKLIGFSKENNREAIAKLVEELSQRWKEANPQQKPKK